MSQSKKAWYELHSWSGALLALGFYVLFLSGCITVFYPQLQSWQYPELRGLEGERGHIAFQQILSDARDRGLITDQALFFLPPDNQAVVLKQHDRLSFYRSDNGAWLATRPEGALRFTRELHSDFALPFPLGAFLVGFCGLLLLMMVVSGLVLHRRFYRHWFTLRRRQFRLAWSDAHKLAGLWGALFYAFMGLSGAFLGLYSLFVIVTASAAFPGGPGAGQAQLQGVPGVASGQPGPWPEVNLILARAKHNEPPLETRFVTISHLGDANWEVFLEGVHPGRLSAVANQRYNAQGERIHLTDDGTQGLGLAGYGAVMNLHLADFSGRIRLIYLIFGLAALFMPVSGLLLWAQRRVQSSHGIHGSTRLAEALWNEPLVRRLCALVLALPIALAGCFLLDRWGFAARPILAAAFVLLLVLTTVYLLRLRDLPQLGCRSSLLLAILMLIVAASDLFLYGLALGSAAAVNGLLLSGSALLFLLHRRLHRPGAVPLVQAQA